MPDRLRDRRCSPLPAARAAAAQPAQPAKPQARGFIVVDQLRSDYLTWYGSRFEHGLKRLTSAARGSRTAPIRTCDTVTCAGHATIGTGTLPYQHGMINNAWFDRGTAASSPATTDPDVAGGQLQRPAAGAGDSAKRMMAPTLAEQVMREAR